MPDIHCKHNTIMGISLLTHCPICFEIPIDFKSFKFYVLMSCYTRFDKLICKDRIMFNN